MIINCCGINYCGTYFWEFGQKSQKFDPQNTVLDKSNKFRKIWFENQSQK